MHSPEHIPSVWPLESRVRWLRAFRDRVATRRDDLVGLCVEEVHKTSWEALTADVLPLLASIKWHERYARRVLRERRLPGAPWWTLGQRHREVRAPLGTVGIIATWNYPIQLLGIQVVQALAAGNRVVVKPSERSPRAQEMLLSLAIDAGLPSGQLEWTDASREAGARMLRDRRFDHVVFTGSTAVGREIARWAAETLTPTTLELSGRDSAFVLDDADPVIAARSIWNGATTNAGQTCMAPRRALVDRAIYLRFLNALAPLAAGAKPRRLIDEDAAKRVIEFASDACARGGRSITGTLEPRSGDRVTPVAIVDCPDDAPLVEGDHFGPALAIVPVESIDHALAIHARCDQHLATSVFTRSKRRARSIASSITTTTVTVNDCLIPTGHPASSISGRGRSGWGESRGVAGLVAMSRPVHLSMTARFRPSVFEPTPPARARFEGMVSRFYGRKEVGRKAPRSGADASGDEPGTMNEGRSALSPRPDREPTDAPV